MVKPSLFSTITTVCAPSESVFTLPPDACTVTALMITASSAGPGTTPPTQLPGVEKSWSPAAPFQMIRAMHEILRSSR